MGWEKCSRCSEEYFIKELKSPMKDSGDSLSCLKCGTELISWGKGTTYYLLNTKEQIQAYEKHKQWEEANYPKCKCGITMSVRTGPYGKFLGVVGFLMDVGKQKNII